MINRVLGIRRSFCLELVIQRCSRSLLPLKDIKQFFQWCEEGDSTIDQRYELFIHQKKKTEKQISILQNALDRINYKCEFYRISKENGTTNVPELRKELAMKFLNKNAENNTADK